MVYQSVLNDLKATLTDLDWYDTAGTINAAYKGVLSKPLRIDDFYPEEGLTAGNAPAPNLLAMDDGTPGQPYLAELGGPYEQQYLFQMQLIAESDTVAKMIFSDMADRYLGLTQPDYITLYNYGASPVEEVCRLEVDRFIFAPDNETPGEFRFYIAELEVTDRLDQA
jgi:hypothetical protein